MESLTMVLLGIGLAAAAGFRVFVPPLALALAARLGAVELPPEAAWLADSGVVAALAVATLLEVFAYFIPIVDNLLDTIAAPAAVIAGSLLSGIFLPEGEPLLRWVAAVALGGGAAGGVQALTTLTRLGSTGTTGGLANPLVSAGELLGAAGLSLLSLLAPVLAAALAVVLVVAAVRRLWRRGQAREG